ncbi:unnamed protein product [Rhizoctonia solani]|uniref:Uncharacterized protein n=1 Tax=Rhizoctonia solani TaxID=456999 RepID=A0A8H2X0Z9_9AGAM|nr:unnamed protein product [Rhizoctonia solani]
MINPTDPTLSETRDKIACLVHRLPEEILVEIFSRVVYSPPTPYSLDGVVEMEKNLLKIYQSLHTLLGVPIMHFSGDPKHRGLPQESQEAMELSLERAQGRSLDIAAVIGLELAGFSFIRFDTLERHLSRIRTINLVADDTSYIRRMMDVIVQGPARPSSLLELSLCRRQNEQVGSYRVSRPAPWDHLYSRKSPSFAPFNKLLASLPVLRINGVYIQWDKLVFSNRLTKLRLQEINLGADRIMIGQLHYALASATGLRDFEIVSVESVYDPGAGATQTSMISLPNLESLLVDDLYCNTLFLLFSCIKSRSHRLTLRLTWNSLCFNITSGSRPRVSRHRLLRRVLEQVSVHKLCIHADIHPAFKKFGKLMKSVPMLDTLFLDEAEFTEYCNALERQETQGNEPQSSYFPSFRCLHFSRATIRDMAAFKRMVASHSQSMRQMIIGGCVYASTLPDSEVHHLGEDRDKDKEFISQLEEIIPEVRLTSAGYIPPEFQHDRWQLW